MNNTFKYNNYTFEPVKRIEKENRHFKYIDAHISVEKTLTKGIFPYDCNEFYEASNGSTADIFKCLETGILYLPSELRLYAWVD